MAGNGTINGLSAAALQYEGFTVGGEEDAAEQVMSLRDEISLMMVEGATPSPELAGVPSNVLIAAAAKLDKGEAETDVWAYIEENS